MSDSGQPIYNDLLPSWAQGKIEIRALTLHEMEGINILLSREDPIAIATGLSCILAWGIVNPKITLMQARADLNAGWDRGMELIEAIKALSALPQGQGGEHG